MDELNPVAVFFVIFTASIGHVFGHIDIGLAVGSGLMLIGSLKS